MVNTATCDPDRVYLLGVVFTERLAAESSPVPPDELRSVVVIGPATRDAAIAAFLQRNPREQVISAVTLREIDNAAGLMRRAQASVETTCDGVEIIEDA